MATRTSLLPDLVRQKLMAFEQIQPEFEQSFLFLARVHGQQRFASFTVADVVRYLHTLWIGECKTSLLSITRTVKEYEGAHCLDLLQHWQESEDTASVVSFLYRKLDMMPLADITRQVQEAYQGKQSQDLCQRLMYGRKIMFNRGMNLMQMLDALFALSPMELATEVQSACVQYKHLPEQIAQQRAAFQSALYAYMPHQALEERNMLVMNTLTRQIMGNRANQPIQRTEPIEEPSTSSVGNRQQPFAEFVFPAYISLSDKVHHGQ